MSFSVERVRHFRVYQSKCVEKGHTPFQCFKDKVNLVTFLDKNENFYLACTSCSYRMYLPEDMIDYIVKLVESWEDDSK